MQDKNKTEEQTTITAQELMQKIGYTAFRVDFMKSPEDALVFHRIKGKGELEGQDLNGILLEKWEFLHFEKLINAVAKKTGADLEQLRNPETRTEEQQAALLQAGAFEQHKRIEMFFNSLYYQALESLNDAKGEYISLHQNDPDYIDTKEQAVLYFFATHEQLQPESTDTLTDEHKEELKALFYRLDKFYLENGDTDNSTDLQQQPLYKFLQKELIHDSTIKEPTKLKKVIIAKLNDFYFPIDKVNSSIWDSKDDISTTAITIPLKAEPDKSRKQVTNNVVLWLDELEGNTAIQRLTQYDLRVYMAIGNLFEAGNVKISIKDIYKAMGNSKNPAPDQRQKILLAIEKMSSIRITIDTSEEEQADYKYPNLHIKRRNLIYTKVDIVLGLV